MSTIVVDRIEADGRTLTCDLRTRGDIERFFTGKPFEVSYDCRIEDVPEGVLAIPVLAHVCPVAWANGGDVYVDEVDATFARALEDVESELASMYDFVEGGELYARRTIDRPPDARGESGLLFTGGVDSTCSYVRHREDAPILVSIRGWTITPDTGDDDKWAALRERVSAFAADRDLETAFLETNALSALDHAMLLAHYRHRVDGSWYSSVGHGVGLLGLCAPMAYARGIEDLYVAATHWEGVDLEWGSCPAIDDRVRWAGTQCHHDGYELTRQERVDVIADYVDDAAPGLELQTCNRRMDGNCGECEKCYRTAVGLRLAGLDPTEHGYSLSPADYAEIRRSLERGEWELGEDERYMWADIRDRVRETDPTSQVERQFFEWLLEADLEGLVSTAEPPLSHRLLRAGARNTPSSVYGVAYPAWKSLQSGIERVR